MELEQLLLAARDGDPDAWVPLIPKLDRALLQFFRRRYQDPMMVHDLTQEALLTIVERIRGLATEQSMVAWAFGIAWNVLNKRIRHHNRAAAALAMLARVSPTPDTGAASRLELQSQRALLRAEIEQLPPHHRRAIELELDGRGIATLAELENIPRVTARSRRHRAHQQLRERIHAQLPPATPT